MTSAMTPLTIIVYASGYTASALESLQRIKGTYRGEELWLDYALADLARADAALRAALELTQETQTDAVG